MLTKRRVALIECGANAPVSLAVSELRGRYLGSAIALTLKVPLAADPDGIDSQSGKFGLRWFVPELLKHRRIWRDVLSGSLVLQLIGLALPLFTQVIIDKVVVHGTKSTLIALGVAVLALIQEESLFA